MRALLLCLGMLVLSTLSASAQAHGPMAACRDDVQKFCADVQPGEGRIIKCLKLHENELSSGCRAAGEYARAHENAFKAACQHDIETVCKGVEPGGGRIIACLKAHQDQLSEGCRSQPLPPGPPPQAPGKQ
jgi:hypothetical protein